MELFLLFAGIIVLNIVVKKMQEKAQHDKRRVNNPRSAESAPRPLTNDDTPQSLQDLIRKFNERQQAESASVPETIEKEYHPSPVESAPALLDEEKKVIQTHREQWETQKKEQSNPHIESIAKPSLLIHTTPMQKKQIVDFHFNLTEARKGFIWAKVIDDPRFRRRSPFSAKA
jgi:hypothetical protein